MAFQSGGEGEELGDIFLDVLQALSVELEFFVEKRGVEAEVEADVTVLFVVAVFKVRAEGVEANDGGLFAPEFSGGDALGSGVFGSGGWVGDDWGTAGGGGGEGVDEFGGRGCD